VSDYPDDPLKFTRRDAKGEFGRQLVRKARDFAQEDDEQGFKEMLRRLGIWDDTPRFEEAVTIFWELCRELRQQGRR
jgi:hypothetical protein